MKTPEFIKTGFDLYLEYGNRAYLWLREWIIERLKETLFVLAACFLFGAVFIAYSLYIHS